MASRTTVAALAGELRIDCDLALVTLWDLGFDSVEDADQVLNRELYQRAYKALGGWDYKDLQRLAFWESAWGLERLGVIEKLSAEFGILVSPRAKVLPAGALRRLRREQAIPEPELVEVVPRESLRPASQTIFHFGPPGKRRESEFLVVEEILQVHEALVEAFRDGGDPIDPPGVKEIGLLESAAMRPQVAMGDTFKYPTVESQAGALLHSLVHNHSFHNGNKRTALVSMLVFMDRNGLLLTCLQQDLFKHVLMVAQHRVARIEDGDRADREVQAISEWIFQNSRSIQRGERNISWRELRPILTNYGCVVGKSLPGNRIRLTRAVEVRKGLFGRRRYEELSYTTGYRNEGSDVGKSQLQKIRRAMALAEEDGYDSEHFYGRARRAPDSFISEYRLLLRRLGRL